jgi:hypothetical protein
MATDFSATLAPPTGVSTNSQTKIVGRSGQAYKYDGSTHITTGSQEDLDAFVSQGWSVVSVTPPSAGGNQG